MDEPALLPPKGLRGPSLHISHNGQNRAGEETVKGKENDIIGVNVKAVEFYLGYSLVLFFLPWTGSEHFHPTSPAWSQVKVSIFISLSAHALLHLPGEAARKSGKSLACGIHRIRGRCQLCHR